MVATSSKKRSRVAPLPDRPEAGEVEVKPVVINGDNSSSKNTSKFSQASETFITNSSKDESSSYTDTKVSITFLGFNITSKIGIQAFKVMSVCIPLIPTLLLILYNSVQLEGLWSRSSILAENYSRVTRKIFMSTHATFHTFFVSVEKRHIAVSSCFSSPGRKVQPCFHDLDQC